MAVDVHSVERSEMRWASAMAGVAGILLAAILYAALVMHLNPPGEVETIDPQTLQLTGEFSEPNLGTKVEARGAITTRVVTAQFAFLPQCVLVPQNRPVTLRLASPDVIHGIIVMGTNVNTMVVPGYVSTVHTTFTKTGDLLMPCHEFCGLGHSQMIAHVKVVPESEFHPDAEGRASCDPR
jgi:cytochrome c oxidase subunit 2